MNQDPCIICQDTGYQTHDLFTKPNDETFIICSECLDLIQEQSNRKFKK